MKSHLGAVALAAVLLSAAAVGAQGQNTPPSAPPATTPAQDPNKNKTQPPAAAPLTLDSAGVTAPPVNAEEDAAVKTFRDVPATDLPKKNKAGEDFVQKYPQSRYRPEIYAWLVKGYLGTDQPEKMEIVGDQELALVPTDAQVLAIVGSTLPRAMNASTPEPEKRLQKAEDYCKRALDVVTTMPKPSNLNDEEFATAKAQISAMAYSGLGVVAFRRGKFADAIPNFEQAAKVDPNPDPVNFYLLGISDEKASHFDDAVTAFTKCSSFPGGMQATCKGKIDEAKKLGATQLSAPK
jgi:tetratricopeptide (TPR) repeat protein